METGSALGLVCSEFAYKLIMSQANEGTWIWAGHLIQQIIEII